MAAKEITAEKITQISNIVQTNYDVIMGKLLGLLTATVGSDAEKKQKQKQLEAKLYEMFSKDEPFFSFYSDNSELTDKYGKFQAIHEFLLIDSEKTKIQIDNKIRLSPGIAALDSLTFDNAVEAVTEGTREGTTSIIDVIQLLFDIERESMGQARSGVNPVTGLPYEGRESEPFKISYQRAAIFLYELSFDGSEMSVPDYTFANSFLRDELESIIENGKLDEETASRIREELEKGAGRVETRASKKTKTGESGAGGGTGESGAGGGSGTGGMGGGKKRKSKKQSKKQSKKSKRSKKSSKRKTRR